MRLLVIVTFMIWGLCVNWGKGLLGLSSIFSPPRSWSAWFEFSKKMPIQCFSLELPVDAWSTPSFGSFTFSLARRKPS